MTTRVYTMPVSHPAAAAEAMLAYKRIPHRAIRFKPGFHSPLVRLAGFERFTVPALEMDGRKVQGSRAIARHLESVKPDPPLFPADPDERARVEDAERWGEQVLQPLPRRLFRYLILTSEPARVWMGTDVLHIPAPRVMGRLFMPVIRRLAEISHADEAGTRAALAELPALLDRVDELIAAGTIGGARPNAADFQILAAVRVLLEFEDLGWLVHGRPSVAPARRLYPRWVGPIPRALPVP